MNDTIVTAEEKEMLFEPLPDLPPDYWLDITNAEDLPMWAGEGEV